MIINTLKSRLTDVRDFFEDVRPRTAEGRVVTGTDALAIAGVVAAGIRLEMGDAKHGSVDFMATSGVVIGVGVAAREIYQHGVGAAIEHALVGPTES